MRTFRHSCLVLLLLYLSMYQIKAQNLVPNSGFETILAQPTSENQINLAQPWQPLNATPDLFHRGQVNLPINPCDQVDIPLNVGGYTPERTGKDGYAGLQFDFSSNYREYISAPLAIPLQKDTLYRVEFYVIRADSGRFGCNKIGALFTNNIPIQPGVNPINFPANIESNNVINDTINWTLVTGIYQATGGENYITLGLFRVDADPLLVKSDFGTHFTGCANLDFSAYYFVDDITVRPVTEVVYISGDTIICPNEATTLTANTNVPFWWSDENNPNDTLSLLPEINIIPTVPIKYYLNGLYVRDSVTVTIVNPPAVFLGIDSLLCEGDTILLDATEPSGIAYYWSTGETTSSIRIADLGSYWVIVDNTGCSRADTIDFPSYLSNPPIDLGLDSLYCFFIKDTLHLDAGIADSYLWSPTNETTQQITILQPGVYSVNVIRSNGCPRKASIETFEVCIPTVFIPNAFTPDGDGLNDLFQPKVANTNIYNLRILTRFGQTIFFSEDPGAGWDGTFEGKDAPIGVYVYRINFEGLNEDGDKFKGKKLGFLTLLR